MQCQATCASASHLWRQTAHSIQDSMMLNLCSWLWPSVQPGGQSQSSAHSFGQYPPVAFALRMPASQARTEYAESRIQLLGCWYTPSKAALEPMPQAARSQAA
eukprot:5376367-Amphidinium_carterae.2